MSKQLKEPKEEPKTWVCYWQDDSSPIPQINVEKKNVSEVEADAWLKSVSRSEHWTPKIRNRVTLKA